MATRTSSLIVSLVDRVTAPARKVSRGLLGITKATKDANGVPTAFSDRLNSAIARNNRALDAQRGRMMDAIGGFYALKAAIASPVSAAMDFEDAMADVRKVVDFPTPEAYADFQKQLMGLSKEIPITVSGLAQIAAAAGQAGIAGEDLVKFTETAAKIGTAFDISADEAGTALSKLMTGLGMNIDEVTSLSDAMNHLSNSQAATASEILDVVRRVGAQGKQFGFTAEQTAAFASAMIAAGAQSDVAATSFRNMGKALTRGESATKRQTSAFAKLGLDATKVARQMQEDAVGTTLMVMQQLAKLPAEVRASVSSDLFGDEARALGPLLTNLDLAQESLGLVGEKAAYAGSAFKEFENRNNTFSSKLQRFKNTIEALMIVIGDALIPVLTQLIEKLAPVIDKIAMFIDNNSQLVGTILSVVGALVAFRVAASTLKFVGLLGRGGALDLLALGMKTVGRAGLGIGGAAGNMIAMRRSLAALSGTRLGFFGTIKAGLEGIVTAIPGARRGLLLLRGAFGLVGTAIRSVIALMIANPIGVAVAAIAGAAYLIYRNWDAVAPYFQRLWETVKKYFSGLVDFVAGIFTLDLERSLGGLKAMFEAVFKDFPTILWDAGVAMFNALWDGMKSVWTGLKEWVGGIGDAIVDPFKNAAGKIKGFFSFGGGDDGGGGIDGAKAKGGPISRGKNYLVGEDGPELITASRSGYVNTAGKTASRSMKVDVGGISIYPAPGQSAREIANEVMRTLEQSMSDAMNGLQADGGVEVY